MTESRFAELTMKLWRLLQRFDALTFASPEARETTRTEIQKILKKLQPEENRGSRR
jgi:hypothetical protein